MYYAIIGGTGFESPFSPSKEKIVETPYGEAKLIFPENKPYLFVSRHGAKHTVPPHKVPYRANIWALKTLGVTEVYGISAVGSLNKNYAPDSVLLCEDFLDFTKSRAGTFFDGDDHPAKHIAMDAPYDALLNREFEEAFGENLPRGVYVATEGPRFESRAEIKFYASIGGDVVGMTNVPEVVLAREMGLHYANICHIVNYCTGIDDAVAISQSEDIRRRILLAIDRVFDKKRTPRKLNVEFL